MRHPDGDRVEYAPTQVPRAIIVDEAQPTRLDHQVCFDLILRTEAIYDLPVDKMKPQCLLDGLPAESTVRETMAAQRENYPYEVYHAGDLEPTPYDFEIVRRRATICCDHPVLKLLELRLQNHLMSEGPDGGPPFQLHFQWELRDAP